MIEGAVPAGNRTLYLILVYLCPAAVDRYRTNRGNSAQIFLPNVALDR